MSQQTKEEVTYTPGPWIVLDGVCRNDHPDSSADVIDIAERRTVANCGCHQWARANARLIAAAPDYWSAVELMRVAGTYSRDDRVCIPRSAYDALLQAHAKAEGRGEGHGR